MTTKIFIELTFAIIVVYDVIAYEVGLRRGVGGKYTISTNLYNLSKRPVIGPILLVTIGGLLYHLFVCAPGCG